MRSMAAWVVWCDRCGTGWPGVLFVTGCEDDAVRFARSVACDGRAYVYRRLVRPDGFGLLVGPRAAVA